MHSLTPDNPPVVDGRDPLEYRTIVKDSGDPGYVNRVMIGTAVTGLVRIEWVQARYGQMTPANWSAMQFQHIMDSYMPLRYEVADAQNLIVQEAVRGDYRWLLLWEHDVVPPANTFLIFNEYMREEETPVVSGLYYTRSRPSEPVVYRGRGTSFYDKWEKGDKVWVDGVPTGLLLVHMSILRLMYEEAEEYRVRGATVRKVFETPRHLWQDPESGQMNSVSGTSDLDWCDRVIKKGYLERSGWKKYQDMQYPFLIDTRIACRHINPSGEVFP